MDRSVSRCRFELEFQNITVKIMYMLQSYGIHYRDETDVEVITYVDFVDPNGHAHKAGLRPGTNFSSFLL